jgi:hypothetical protein
MGKTPYTPIGTFLNFVDTSVVSLSGVVSIANTAQYNGDSNIPCPVIDVEVCAVNHFGVRESIDCTKTDATGMLFFFAMILLIDYNCRRSVLFVCGDGSERRNCG